MESQCVRTANIVTITASANMLCKCTLCGDDYELTRQHLCRQVCPICWHPSIRDEITRIRNAINRAKRAGVIATLTLVEWLETLDDFNGKCAYCGQGQFEILEHFIPISHGGGTTVNNCIPSCGSCNVKKALAKRNKAEFPISWLNRAQNYLERR